MPRLFAIISAQDWVCDWIIDDEEQLRAVLSPRVIRYSFLYVTL